jgi:hypothetical protein
MRNQNQNTTMNYSILFKKINNFKYASLLSIATLLMFVVFPFNTYGQTTLVNCTTPTKEIEVLRFRNELTYVPGSNITVFINPKGFYEIDNQFKLFLFNVSNNTEILLSTKNDFFIPILNGIIPLGTSPGSYKLKIKAKSVSNASDTEVEVLTSSFQIATGTIQNSSITLDQSGGNLNSLNNFVKCLDFNTNNYQIGFLNNSNPTTTTQDLVISNVGPSNGVAQLFKLVSSITPQLNYQLGAPQIITAPLSQIQLPIGIGVGTYLIEYTKTVSGYSSTYGVIFLNTTASTGLGNLSNESVCVDNDVLFTVDVNSIKDNYPGSLYKFSFGDGSGDFVYTHNKIITCNDITHFYDQVTCSSDDKVLGPNPDPISTLPYYYFRADFKQLNKYLNINNIPVCDTYNVNGNGTTKWINVNLPPDPNFNVADKVCIGSNIVATEESINPEFGFGENCLIDYSVKWEVKFPGQSVFATIASSNINSPYYGWVKPCHDASLIKPRSSSQRPTL